MRRAAKLDGNHRTIKVQLRAAGYRVFDTTKYGDGFPDMVVPLKNGRVAMLFELKSQEGGEVTKDECRFMMQMVEPVYRMCDTFEQVDEILKDNE